VKEANEHFSSNWSGLGAYFFLALALAFFLAFFFGFFPELHPHVLHICQSFHIRRSIVL